MANDVLLDPEVLRPLFATPPPEFVAARNVLAKQLRADKQRDTAALVAKLRRPGWVDWALNAVAAEQPDLVGDFADAAEVLREAQAASIEGRDGPDLRGALRAQRDATTALGRRAGAALRGAGRPPDTAEVVARLGEVAAQAEAVTQLRLGVLGSADPGDDDLFGGLVPATPARPAAAARRRSRLGRRPPRTRTRPRPGKQQRPPPAPRRRPGRPSGRPSGSGWRKRWRQRSGNATRPRPPSRWPRPR